MNARCTDILIQYLFRSTYFSLRCACDDWMWINNTMLPRVPHSTLIWPHVTVIGRSQHDCWELRCTWLLPLVIDSACHFLVFVRKMIMIITSTPFAARLRRKTRLPKQQREVTSEGCISTVARHGFGLLFCNWISYVPGWVVMRLTSRITRLWM